MERVNDPKYIGPGCWYTLHLLASKAVNKQDKLHLIKLINIYKEFFSCKVCKKHFADFCLRYPPEEWVMKNAQEWCVMAHNNANKILSKDKIELSLVNAFYEKEESCTAACHQNNYVITSCYY